MRALTCFFFGNARPKSNARAHLKQRPYSNAPEIFYAHGNHLGDQHKLLIIPLEDVPLLLRNGFHGNSTQFYVLCIFKAHEIKFV